ncbi:MAG TPA: TIGR02996 domain-containing protein [Thermoanaerobaculia bacterium]|jgi:uncharacterized protein (TIGR02996 family)|nr:TIGR02996 domain-containing protein [Thermoanaerobaculia bacterium]
MPGEDAFFEAILENPDDDGPRLALADGLNGNPRAELIRVQCELAKVPRDPVLPTFPHWLFEDWNCDLPSLTAAVPSDLLDREQQLLDLHEETWIRPVQESVRPCRMSPGELRDFQERPRQIEKPLYGWQFHRGLVDTVYMEGRAFVNDADRLFRSAPVQNVWLYRPAGLMKSLVALPAVARLKALDLGGMAIYHYNMDCITDKDLGALASCPYLSRLTTLGLSCHDIGRRGVEALTYSPHLPRLTALNLGSNPFLRDRQGVETLAGSPLMERLTGLWLGGDTDLLSCKLRDAGVTVLADSPRVAGLRMLGLSSGGIGVPGIEALAASPYLFGLEVLALGYNDFGDDGAKALARASHWTRLRMLDLDDNSIGDAGVEAIVGSAWLSQLQVLNLNRNQIGERGLRALLESPDLSRLQALGLGDNRVLDQGIAMLTACPGLTDLRLLDLFNAGIGEAGVVALANAPSLSRLRQLKLHGSRPGRRGIEALVASPYLGNLRALNLNYSELGDVEAELLASAPSLARLARLEVARNAFSDRGIQALQDRFARRVILKYQ